MGNAALSCIWMGASLPGEIPLLPSTVLPRSRWSHVIKNCSYTSIHFTSLTGQLPLFIISQESTIKRNLPIPCVARLALPWFVIGLSKELHVSLLGCLSPPPPPIESVAAPGGGMGGQMPPQLEACPPTLPPPVRMGFFFFFFYFFFFFFTFFFFFYLCRKSHHHQFKINISIFCNISFYK